MNTQDQAEYIEFKRKRRQRSLRSPKEHRGTVEEFVNMADNQARALGSIRPVQFWGMQAYAKEMFAYIADPRMLYRAFASLKGEAHGFDGVRPRDIGRYVVYREWCEACRLHGSKAPAYADSVFPKLDDFGLYVFHCANDPERRYRTERIEFDWDDENGDRNGIDQQRAYPKFRETLEELGAMRSGFFATLPVDERKQKIRNIESSVPGKTRKGVTQTRLMLPGVYTLDEGEQERYRNLLYRAGLGEESVGELADKLLTGIGRLFELEHAGRAKSFIAAITPLKYLLDYDNAKDEDNAKSVLCAMRNAVNWAAMRWIGRLIEKVKTNGKGYRPQPLRRVEIPKSDGGVRTLSLPTAIDRIVAKSALMTIQPVLEKVFLPSSIGCRFDKDRFDALAALADRYPSSPGKIILVADIQKAFDNVPHDRLMEVVRTYIPNQDTLTLLERFVRRPGFESGVGLAQGDPLSPFFLNMLLHEHLDAPLDELMKKNGLTYFRYVDDLSVFGLTSRDQGEQVIGIIGDRLRHVGLSLHTKAPKTQIVDLTYEPVEYYTESDASDALEIDRYLGLGLRGGKNGELEFFLPSSWEERIRDMYVRAEQKIALGGYEGSEGAQKHIFHATESWIKAFAPALQYEDKEQITSRIVEICHDASHHSEETTPDALSKSWDDAQEWWLHKCSEVSATVHEKK